MTSPDRGRPQHNPGSRHRAGREQTPPGDTRGQIHRGFNEYFDRGAVYLSTNAGTFRLLLPDVLVSEIAEWRGASEVIVSRGPWPDEGRSDALEILIEDGSASPYSIHLGTEQVDRMPLDTDRDRQGQPPRWKFSVWTSAGKALELPCRYRIVKKLPCLKKF